MRYARDQAPAKPIRILSRKKRPVVRNDQIVIGHVMLLSLSFDHRVIDGDVGARFAKEIIQLLEDPGQLILGV